MKLNNQWDKVKHEFTRITRPLGDGFKCNKCGTVILPPLGIRGFGRWAKQKATAIEHLTKHKEV